MPRSHYRHEKYPVDKGGSKFERALQNVLESQESEDRPAAALWGFIDETNHPVFWRIPRKEGARRIFKKLLQ